jgi:hypothetical protein
MHGVLLQTALQFLCYPSAFSDQLVDFFHVVLSYNSSFSTSVGLMGDVCVSVPKMFQPLYDTAGTHADISTHTTKSLIE